MLSLYQNVLSKNNFECSFMKKKSEKPVENFADLLKDSKVKPLVQDKHFFKKNQKQPKKSDNEQSQSRQASVELSDQYQPLLPEEGPMRYIRSGADHHLLKRLRRGDFTVEATLDLHGHTKQQAKSALIDGLSMAHQQHMVCLCVTHGHGHGILKEQVPHWLVQHPNVVAFHEAPKRLGGGATLCVLLDTFYAAHHKDELSEF
jgi:DNA-nicking Smr family endonuclease